MDKNAKVSCYKEMYARFKGNPDVKNLTYPKEKENLDFSFTIGEFKVLFSLKMETELFEVRGITYFPEKTDEEDKEEFEIRNISVFAGVGILAICLILIPLCIKHYNH